VLLYDIDNLKGLNEGKEGRKLEKIRELIEREEG
jgi:hypothetical protein